MTNNKSNSKLTVKSLKEAREALETSPCSSNEIFIPKQMMVEMQKIYSDFYKNFNIGDWVFNTNTNQVYEITYKNLGLIDLFNLETKKTLKGIRLGSDALKKVPKGSIKTIKTLYGNVEKRKN